MKSDDLIEALKEIIYRYENSNGDKEISYWRKRFLNSLPGMIDEKTKNNFLIIPSEEFCKGNATRKPRDMY